MSKRLLAATEDPCSRGVYSWDATWCLPVGLNRAVTLSKFHNFWNLQGAQPNIVLALVISHPPHDELTLLTRCELTLLTRRSKIACLHWGSMVQTQFEAPWIKYDAYLRTKSTSAVGSLLCALALTAELPSSSRMRSVSSCRERATVNRSSPHMKQTSK